MHHNQLTGEIPLELGNLINVGEFYLNDNQLTGEIPPEFCNQISPTYRNNNLCPPYPSCVEDYLGVQNTSECVSEDVTDVDENIYKTTVIGSQIWMAENLNVTKYKNGGAIPNVTDNTEWGELTSGANCDLNNDPSISTTHGRIYNWYAVDNSFGVCMEGWHVPSKEEWDALVEYLGGTGAGGKMKEEGTTHWSGGNGTNESGFTAIAMGYRNAVDGNFYDYPDASGGGATQAYWWSSSKISVAPYGDGFAEHIGVANTNNVIFGYNPWRQGFSIRCLQD